MFGRVLNEGGTISSVVHQWDRSEHLSQQFFAQYPILTQNELVVPVKKA